MLYAFMFIGGILTMTILTSIFLRDDFEDIATKFIPCGKKRRKKRRKKDQSLTVVVPFGQESDNKVGVL
jgi:hypothetical protein